MALEMTGRGYVTFVCPRSLPTSLFSEANIECGQWTRKREVRELTGSVFEYSMLGVKARACVTKANIPSSYPTLQVSRPNFANICDE